ncbi:MAG: hypothetical protein OK438_01425 [Thaumarchaeota archaeon]|nr:hypothetical protein [Nitrososphaerota archaeon]
MLVQQFKAIQFKAAGVTNGTQHFNETFGYHVTSNSGGIINMTITSVSGTQGTSIVALVDSNNNTVLSVSFSGFKVTGSQAKTEFDSFMALFGLEGYYGGQVGVLTDSSYFHSTGTSSFTNGTSFQVTNYEANTLPQMVNSCGFGFNLTAYTLSVGTPPNTSLQFITFLHIAGTNLSNQSTEDYTFQLVSMTVA